MKNFWIKRLYKQNQRIKKLSWNPVESGWDGQSELPARAEDGGGGGSSAQRKLTRLEDDSEGAQDEVASSGRLDVGVL